MTKGDKFIDLQFVHDGEKGNWLLLFIYFNQTTEASENHDLPLSSQFQLALLVT